MVVRNGGVLCSVALVHVVVVIARVLVLADEVCDVVVDVVVVGGVCAVGILVVVSGDVVACSRRGGFNS